MTRAPRARPGQITAVLGPTNTGKTHLALERMLGRASGVIGLPLRLLARELYDKVVRAKGEAAAALVTGEEKIVPPKARYFVCTVEAMPLDLRPAFLAVDEIQLCSDPERGHVFTERLLHARGTEETMFMGSATFAPMLRRLVPEADQHFRERFSTLSYSGQKKVTRLPRRSAVVAFTANRVYSIAELIRRQRGGAAVVMGGLSPRTRNAQVELYQSGEVDYLIATDAIGMGLNMDVDHVAFAGLQKYDGRRKRRLHPHEVGQIAGRAGRFRSDGTFGETADCRPMDAELVSAVENHTFDPVTRITWRNHDLDLSSLEALRASLNRPSPEAALERVRYAIDEAVLDILSRDEEVRERAVSKGAVARLWDACRTPDFRKTTLDEHARLVKRIFLHRTQGDGLLPETWLEGQLVHLNRTAGEVDQLSARLAHVRTWAYAANRNDWTARPAYWRERTREVEDQLSDALHERLMARFIDRRTSALIRSLREKTELEAVVMNDGAVTVEGHHVGEIHGLRFALDAQADGALAQRTMRNATAKAVRPEMNRRLGRLVKAEDDALSLNAAGEIEWEGAAVGRIGPGGDPLAPSVTLIGGELGADEARARAERRMERYVAGLAQRDLAALARLRGAVSGAQAEIDGLARGIAYRLVERFGAAPRADLALDVAQLSQAERRQLRQAGVRIGEHAVFAPALVKPAAARLNALLKAASEGDPRSAFLPQPGLTSLAAADGLDAATLAAAGFQRCGPLLVRLDILERLADLIREARAAEPAEGEPARPRGAFAPTAAMTNLLGCSVETLRGVLKTLGYKRIRKGQAAEKLEGELWAGRARKPARPRPDAEAPEPSAEDTPFAKLAELDIARPRPAQARKGADAPRRRKPRKRRKSERKDGA